jgi:uncharacterized alpha-E superfamily protein
MLSRIAESLYWIGRYVERAEDTARILDVHFHLLVEDRSADATASYRTLLHAMGLPHAVHAAPPSALASMLIHNAQFDGSIASSIGAAWTNARGTREVISSELWECLNVTHRSVDEWDRTATPFETLRWVKERAALAAGLIDTTMSRDDGWRFLALGRSIERADMTVRLLSARYGDRWGAAGWRVLLRCCSAHEAFLRRHHGQLAPELALEFLLLDREFPRSVLFSLREAAACVSELDPAVDGDRRRRQSEPHRVLARAAAELAYSSVPELSQALEARLDALERVCNQAHDTITTRYFRASVAIEWSA